MTVQEEPSFYDRLGGVYNIATVIDDLIDRVMADDRLNANPRVDEAHHRLSAAGFKYYVTEMATTARPCRERPRRAGLPDRNLVALAELRRGMLRGVMPSDLESRDESPPPGRRRINSYV